MFLVLKFIECMLLLFLIFGLKFVNVFVLKRENKIKYDQNLHDLKVFVPKRMANLSRVLAEWVFH